MSSATMIIPTLLLAFAAGTAGPDELPRSGVAEVGLPTGSAGPGVASGTATNVNVTMDTRPQNETSIAADPDDPLNLVAGTNDYRYGEVDAGFAYTFDRGQTWQANTLDGVNSALGKYDAQGDPAVAAYRGGVFYFAYIDFNRGDDQNRLAVTKTTDGGQSWLQLGVIIDHVGPGAHDFEDKEFIAVDNTGGPFDGNVYISWTRFPAAGSTRIMFSRSTDGGASFSAPVQISDELGGVQGSVPVVDSRGVIYVAWQRSETILVDKSADGGLTWTTDVLAATIDALPSPLPGADFRVNSFPTIAIDRSPGLSSGNVYLAWADRTGVGQGPDVLLTRSTNGGTSWSTPIRASDDVNGTYQWFPWLSVDPNGNVDIMFFDRRDSPLSTRYHTYYTRSVDDGLSFESNTRVSEEISDALNDGFGGAFIGDYNGMVSTDNGVHPFWTDGRDANGNAEGYTANVLQTATAVGETVWPNLSSLHASPNPFRSETAIQFDLPTAGLVRLEVFDAAGRRVRRLLSSEFRSPGAHRVTWDARDELGRRMSSGVYFCRIAAGSFEQSRRVVLLR